MLVGVVVTAPCLLLCGLLLVAVGQPLFTDDLWWHLALGRVHLREGPWLSTDPLLFTAHAQPAPAAWLSETLFAGVEVIFGLTGLRILHVALVGGGLALVGSILRRVAGGTARAAWLGTAAFAALASYRLVQLRPHLFSLLALLLLYRLLFESGRPPGWRRIAATGGLMALWVNLHSAFVLGLVLLAVGLVASVVRYGIANGAMRRKDETKAEVDAGRAASKATGLEAARVRGFVLAGGVAAIASLLNPAGLAAYAPYLRAGSSTPSLGRVGDEWVPLGLLAGPSGSQPSLFVWVAVWLLLLGLVALIACTFVRWRRGLPSPVALEDLMLAGIALGFMSWAVRFVWLSFLPIVTLVRAAPAGFWSSRRMTWGGPMAATAILVGFLFWGDWRAVSSFLPGPGRIRDYAEPYPALKYHAHGVWLMADARLEGRLFNEYHLGGFLGYWLAPEVRTFLNGSLNVSQEAIEANWPLRHRRGALPGETFLEALDRLGIELFMGVRTPSLAPGAQPWVFTSGHLERSEGWLLVFRNLLTSLYLRRGSSSADVNLLRLDDYYRRQGVPFDPRVGFEPARVIREASLWARRHGVVPVGHPALETIATDPTHPERDGALDRIASIYSILGEHERAIAIDRALLERSPGRPLARRRLVWNLLHAERDTEARAIAEALAAARGRRTGEALSIQIAELARRWVSLDPEERRAQLATQPFLTPSDASRILSGFMRPVARAGRF